MSIASLEEEKNYFVPFFFAFLAFFAFFAMLPS
jgi:hypothetical protein